MDGATRCIELAEKKQAAILAELRRIIRVKTGVRFKDLERLVGKLRHAAIGIPEGRSLMGPINIFMAMKPPRMSFRVSHSPSPALSFLRDTGSTPPCPEMAGGGNTECIPWRRALLQCLNTSWSVDCTRCR